MKKKLFELWATLLTGVLSLGVVFAYSAQKNIDHQALAAGNGAPTLKLTWDFSANTTTSTTAFTTTQLKEWLETYDTPNVSLTVTATAANYKGSGSTSDSYPEGSWKWASTKNNGTVNISGLPSYTLLKVWAYQWGSDAATLAVNGGTAQTITGAAFNLYTFDGFDAKTTFDAVTVKNGRLLIQKIEFWGC